MKEHEEAEMNVGSRVKQVNIMPGMTCTMSCPHCFNASGPRRQEVLTENEKVNLINGLKYLRPEIINLSGGEPTLYLDLLLSILDQVNFPYQLLLTTNGHFATDINRIELMLSKLKQLRAVQLSFDKYHGRNIESEIPVLLKKYCDSKKIDFYMTVCITSPMDLTQIRKIEELYGCPVIFQKIDGSGRAKETKMEFKYPVFDKEVLSGVCPNTDTISYICGKGFSVCSGNVIFNINSSGFGEAMIEDVANNDFNHEVTKMTFKQRLDKYNIDYSDLEPRLSSACNLCEFIELRKRDGP